MISWFSPPAGLVLYPDVPCDRRGSAQCRLLAQGRQGHLPLLWQSRRCGGRGGCDEEGGESACSQPQPLWLFASEYQKHWASSGVFAVREEHTSLPGSGPGLPLFPAMGLMDRLGLPWCLLDHPLLSGVVGHRTGPGRQGPLQFYLCYLCFPTKIGWKYSINEHSVTSLSLWNHVTTAVWQYKLLITKCFSYNLIFERCVAAKIVFNLLCPIKILKIQQYLDLLMKLVIKYRKICNKLFIVVPKLTKAYSHSLWYLGSTAAWYWAPVFHAEWKWSPHGQRLLKLYQNGAEINKFCVSEKEDKACISFSQWGYKRSIINTCSPAVWALCVHFPCSVTRADLSCCHSVVFHICISGSV